MDEERPEGFERHFRRSPVTDAWEPLWSKRTPDGLIIGLRVDERHCNARGIFHGGVLSTLADNAMGLACAAAAGDASGLLTVHLSVDFEGTASLGQWVEVRARRRKVGGSLAYGAGEIFADAQPIASASAVFKIIRPSERL